jgi:hypothetical protein
MIENKDVPQVDAMRRRRGNACGDARLWPSHGRLPYQGVAAWHPCNATASQ